MGGTEDTVGPGRDLLLARCKVGLCRRTGRAPRWPSTRARNSWSRRGRMWCSGGAIEAGGENPFIYYEWFLSLSRRIFLPLPNPFPVSLLEQVSSHARVFALP